MTASSGLAQWLRDGLSKTIVPSYRLLSAGAGRNPMKYLGILSFSCFVLLGLSGIPLMLYYAPDFTNSYGSILKIMNEVPFGAALQNVHYYASDLMVLLALAHFFYLLFVGKYRYHNAVLWLTGLAFGVLATLEAYTGYVLIMNTRAMMAVDIGSGLLNSISPGLSSLLVGASYSDMLLRVNAIHVVIIPVIMVLLAVVHFPRVLTIGLPAVAAVVGASFVLGGISPMGVGQAFVPNSTAALTVPEWYLSGIYAFLRTGAPAFIAGVFLPFLLIFLLALLPFFGNGGDGRTRLSTVASAFGGSVLAQTILATVWGLRGASLVGELSGEAGLIIDPVFFWSVFIAVGLAAGAATFFIARLPGVRFPRLPQVPVSAALATILACVACQVVLLAFAFLPSLRTAPGPQMTEIGLVIVLFGAAVETMHMMRTEGRSPALADAPVAGEAEPGRRGKGGEVAKG